jgi:phage-related protein
MGMNEPTPADEDDQPPRKPFLRLHGEIRTPPFTQNGRREAGLLIGRLQEGENVGMPAVRPMQSIAHGVLELRVRDGEHNWRIVIYVDSVAVVLLDVFAKKTQKTPKSVIAKCQRRLKTYLAARRMAENE